MNLIVKVNLAIIFLIMLGCKEKSTYEIEGTFTQPTDEEFVYLSNVVFGDDILLDSAKITNNKFRFKGQVETAQLYSLSYPWSKYTGMKMFLLEPDNYSVEINPNDWNYGSVVKGGKFNEQLNALNEKYTKPIIEAQKSGRNRSEIDSLIKISSKAEDLYIKENPTSPVSIVLFLPKMPSMSVIETDKRLEQLSALEYMMIYNSLRDRIDTQLELIAAEKPNDTINSKNLTVYETIKPKDNSIIKALVEKYPSKTLYIDIWGLSCGPCYKEFIYANSLKEKINSEDIEFIYLCTKVQDIKEWKKAIIKHNINGCHFILSNDNADLFYKEVGMKVHSTPHYTVVDKQGKTVLPNAPRPSDEKIETILKNTAK